MTTITIVPDRSLNGVDFRAVAGRHQSVGKTPGEALDAMTAQLKPDERGTLIVIQNQQPDAFFSQEQRRRLEELMSRWRAARDAGSALLAAEQAELEALTQVELEAASRRAAALADGLSP